MTVRSDNAVDFFFRYKHGCSLGRIVMVGETHGAQTPQMLGMRRLGHFALVYLFEGHGRYEDQRGVKRDLSGGDCFLVFPDIPHHYGPVDDGRDWNEFYVVFEGPVFDLWRREGLLLEEDAFFRLEPNYLWLKRFREVVDQKAIPSPQSSLSDISRLQVLLADILGCQASALIGNDESAWLQQAYALIEDAGASRPDYHAIARKLGVSYDVFRRRFARLSGHSPGRYHQVRVVDRACSLLCKTRLTHEEIAEQLGFCDAFYFARAFKQVTSTSPKQFRARFTRSA